VADLRGVGRWILPAAVVEAARRRQVRRELGASSREAWRDGLSRRRWNALTNSRLGLLPNDELHRLEVVVDVGANQGDWTAAALTVARPRLVVCVEPAPAMAEHLRRRFARTPGVEIVEAAAGASAGRATLQQTEHTHNTSLAAPTEQAEQVLGSGMRVVGGVEVSVVPLDDVVPTGPVSLLKVDVQGFERSALAGAEDLLSRTRWLLIEALYFHQYEGDLIFDELHGLLSASGWELHNLSAPFIRSGRAVFSDLLYQRQGQPIVADPPS
jgi:FkbM family methyltransferase